MFESGQATSTAKTNFASVSVQSKAAIPFAYDFGTTDAIAQGGSGQTFVDPGEIAAISTALPDKAYATTLIGGASNVADALLGSGDEIFGTAILAAVEGRKRDVRFQFSGRSDPRRSRR